MNVQLPYLHIFMNVQLSYLHIFMNVQISSQLSYIMISNKVTIFCSLSILFYYFCSVLLNILQCFFNKPNHFGSYKAVIKTH